MFKSYFKSRKWALWAYGGLAFLLLSLFYQTHINVAINEWYKTFYDLMQNAQKNTVDDFWASIRRFFYLAMPYVIVYSLTTYFASHWVFRWREAMTFDYIERWRHCHKDIEGSSQRIQEDIYRFAKIIEDLGVKTVRAFMTLIAFIPILWTLSNSIGTGFLKEIPGSLVWVAITVSLGGLLISWFVGIKLPGLEYNNQKVEAAFRKELVYAEDDKVNYADLGVLINLFTGIKVNYYRLFLHYGYFNIWLVSFSQFMVLVPYMIAGPSLFIGLVTIGTLIQIGNAFGQVRESFSIFINNWTTVTELRSIHKRLKEFEENIGYIK
ncbi:long-chain fatty acid ABC transporter, fused permease and ATPase components, SbmA family [Campylobacter blaseri]|uniref:Transporter n=1 Tax=Campylobacter blaseri TaxID=2042961 RepID=A0A2P8R3W3_9BACT|nr:putative transporter [Campylobacter blaseri]PSM53196.1 transporter [Campylobacter blaseri]PSM54662.1 transporter [Campylobacter blaseri]QKF86861.1 long-chain fatty acid ABC transporter, fused permease and ATPase components, SbmA family [Campylobacter blaseri]